MDDSVDTATAWAQFLALGIAAEDEFDSARARELVHILNRRGEPEVVEWALPLLRDPDPWHRQAAAWVLGQHGFDEGRPFGAQVMPALVAAARSEHDTETKEFLVTAIGHGEDPEWVGELISYANDPHPPLRRSVARSLPGIFGDDEMSEQAIDTLIRLTLDPDPDVRDWATFGLGTQSEQDSTEIRTALLARLDDGDPDGTATSGEAAVGLALRHDPRVFPYLERWLRLPADGVGNLTIEAAGALGDSRLLAPLLALRDAGWGRSGPTPTELDDAISTLQAPDRTESD